MVGESQPWRDRGGWKISDDVRGRPQGKPVQGLEPDVVWELFPFAGAIGRDTQGEWEDASSGDTYGVGSHCANGDENGYGAVCGTEVPCGLLRLSTW